MKGPNKLSVSSKTSKFEHTKSLYLFFLSLNLKTLTSPSFLTQKTPTFTP